MARAEPYPSTLYLDAEELAPRCESIEVLARFALIARQYGLTLTVRHASPELLDLIELVGLSDALLTPR
jgi:hypothetical protein